LPEGQNVTLDATGNDLLYQWSTGEMTATIVVNSMGTYTVTITNPAGCTASDTIVVMIIVSANEQNDPFSLSIMPNPARDWVNIRCVGSATASVQVLDNLGRAVIEDNAFLQDGGIRVLNIAHLLPGVYLLKIIGEGFIKTESIIKQ
jgi:hypothetical protein